MITKNVKKKAKYIIKKLTTPGFGLYHTKTQIDKSVNEFSYFNIFLGNSDQKL